MSRTRTYIIEESVEELEAQLGLLPDPSKLCRVRVLLLLRRGHTLASAAGMVGRSVSTVKRWMKQYQAGGMRGLIGEGRGDLDVLREKIARGEFGDLSEVRGWIEGRRAGNGRRLSGETSGGEADHDPGSGAVMKLIRSLPYGGDIREYGAIVKGELRTMFPEIDHISYTVNAICLLYYTSTPTYIAASQSIANPAATFRIGVEASHAERFWQNLRNSNFPIEDYHPPHEMIFMIRGALYLGMIFIWKEKEKERIPNEVLEGIERLCPLLQLIFFHWIATYQLNHPLVLAFEVAYVRFAGLVGLSTQERRVMMILIAGEPYRSISRMLNISINTVRSHVRSIYNKAGVRNCPALVTKFFALDRGDPLVERDPVASDAGKPRRERIEPVCDDADRDCQTEVMSFMIG